ncbi:MAG: GNAT family N-acetyltransferase [Rhodospirillaceae bacterium]|nr:GNAT family N-acetyltransferase [Rhodospirillaceae bacterium]
MPMDLQTPRLRLRPLTMADAPRIAELVFSDPEVAKGLAHDISRPADRLGFAEAWCRDLGIDGTGAVWAQGGIAGFAVIDHAGALAPGGTVLGVAGIYGPQLEDGRWTGEMFYALGRQFHGNGVMSEAGPAVMEAFCRLPTAGSLYAVYWSSLNPASGCVLRRLGFQHVGPRQILEEYDAARALSFGAFELWRLAEAAGADLPRVAREAAIKLGHLSREGLVSRETALADLRAALGGRANGDGLDAEIAAAFDFGTGNPGLAHYRYNVGAP